MKTATDPLVVMTASQLRALLDEALTAHEAKRATTSEQSDVLSCEEAAALIGVHYRTIARLVRDDGLPTLRRVGKLWRFSRRDVLAWLAKRPA